jgi:hypothetical protein
VNDGLVRAVPPVIRKLGGSAQPVTVRAIAAALSLVRPTAVSTSLTIQGVERRPCVSEPSVSTIRTEPLSV